VLLTGLCFAKSPTTEHFGLNPYNLPENPNEQFRFHKTKPMNIYILPVTAKAYSRAEIRSCFSPNVRPVANPKPKINTNAEVLFHRPVWKQAFCWWCVLSFR